MRRRVIRDPYLVAGIALALSALVLLPLGLPFLAPGELPLAFELALITVVLLALQGGGAPRPSAERRFRRHLTAAWTLWVLIDVAHLVGTEEFFARTYVGLAEDLGWVLFYGLVLVALLERPDLPRERAPSAGMRALDLAATLVFGGALFAYFAVLPATLTPDSYWGALPSLTLYTLLDVCLVARLFYLGLRVREPRWRAAYRWLLASAVTFLVADGGTLLNLKGLAHDVTAGGYLDLVPHLFLLAAVRRGLDARAERSAGAGPAPSGTAALGYALALPAVHATTVLLAEADRTELPRERVVFLACFLLVALALGYQWLLFARGQRLALHQRRVAERLELSRRVEVGGRLAAGIAHDFNNLLQVIRSAVEALRLLSPSAEQRRCLDTIVDATERGAAATRQLSALESRRGDEVELVDLDGLVGELEPMLRRLLGPGVRLVLEPAATPALVSTRRAELEHALLNLAANAADALPAGGVLRLTTDASTAGGGVELTVQDDGVGMPPEVRARAFEPFFTTKAEGKGTGLGLSTVYAAVTRSGGTVEVESAPGAGTTFRLRFPAVTADYELTPFAGQGGTGPRGSGPPRAEASAEERRS